MTMYPFRRKSDISREDSLDAWLNALTSGMNDNTQPEGESLAGAAHEFHAWADDAQEADPAATGPADDLWNTILAGRGRRHVDPAHTDRSADNMESNILAPVGGYAPPKSNRTRKAEATRPLSRSGAWFNAIAAALLLLTLGGGAYLARNSGFGFGGGDDGGRFAAQVVSPEASPVGSAATCDVEPLTTEQILAYVENPRSYMPYGVFGTPSPEEEGQVGEITQGLFEYPMLWRDLTEVSSGVVPSEDTFEEALSIADQFYACERYGTVAQRWALMTPTMVQQEVLIQFPVYRDRQEIIEYIESVYDQSFLRMPTSVDDSLLDRSLLPNPNIRDARAFEYRADWMLMDADLVVYIGQEFRDENGDVVGVSSWDGTPLEGGPAETNGGISLILVHSESTDRWFVYGAYAPRG